MFSNFHLKVKTPVKLQTNVIVKFISKRNQICFVGATGLCGFLYYEYIELNRLFSKVVDIRVLDQDRKRPDYIYIKYHIYYESMLKMKRKQEQHTKWINVLINPIGKWLKTFKHSIAWRLLNIAQNGDKAERYKAIRQLIKFDHLKDWDFRHLAQICDARTAASLAHSGCDKRWFVPVPMAKLIRNPKIILSELNNAVIEMLPHICVEHLMKKLFIMSSTTKKIEPEYIQRSEVKSFNEYSKMKEYCIYLLHITKHPDLCKIFVHKGYLKTLLELKKLFDGDTDALVTLGKCITHISVVPNFIKDFFVTGWITTLVEWRDHPDIRLQMISAKALANLDFDDIHYKLSAPNIYQLYPTSRFLREPKCEVIFIHGLLGGAFITWRQKTRNPSEIGLYESIIAFEEPVLPKSHIGKLTPLLMSDEATKHFVESLDDTNDIDGDWEVVYPDCPEDGNFSSENSLSVPASEWIREDISNEYTHCWPMEWLPEDYPEIRILAIDYPSIATEWSTDYASCFPCDIGRCDLEGKSQYFLEMLTLCNIGKDKPIVWIGHSMGGIIIKKILLKAEQHNCENFNRIARNTNAIVFLGTPHRGTPLAKWKPTVKTVIAPSIEVVELEENNEMLLNLHRNFMDLLHTRYKNINIVSFAENSPTMLTSFKLPLTIVTESSANINYGDYYLIKYDHLSLSKPFYRQSFLYQRIVQVIDEVLLGKYKRCD